MKNILSYLPETQFSGKEIKEWINYQIVNSTSHLKQALWMQRFLNIKDERKYVIRIENNQNWSHPYGRRLCRVYKIG